MVREESCARKERNCLSCLKVGVWKLRGIRRGINKGIFLLCFRSEDVILTCSGIKLFFFCLRWLDMSEALCEK